MISSAVDANWRSGIFIAVRRWLGHAPFGPEDSLLREIFELSDFAQPALPGNTQYPYGDWVTVSCGNPAIQT
jgi:hypothetical protein